MATLELSIVINRPVDEVFAFVSNPENYPKWVASSSEVKITSAEPIGVGTTYRSVITVMGRRIESEAGQGRYETEAGARLQRGGTLAGKRAQLAARTSQAGISIGGNLGKDVAGLARGVDQQAQAGTPLDLARGVDREHHVVEVGAGWEGSLGAQEAGRSDLRHRRLGSLVDTCLIGDGGIGHGGIGRGERGDRRLGECGRTRQQV